MAGERRPLYAQQHLKCDKKSPQIWTLKEFVGSAITSHLPQMDQTPLMLQVLLIDCRQIHSCHTPSCYVLTCGGKMENGPFHIQYSNSFLCVRARTSARRAQPTDRCLEYCGLPALTFSHCAQRGGGQ